MLSWKKRLPNICYEWFLDSSISESNSQIVDPLSEEISNYPQISDDLYWILDLAILFVRLRKEEGPYYFFLNQLSRLSIRVPASSLITRCLLHFISNKRVPAGCLLIFRSFWGCLLGACWISSPIKGCLLGVCWISGVSEGACWGPAGFHHHIKGACWVPAAFQVFLRVPAGCLLDFISN